MLHELLFALHMIGMAVIIVSALYLAAKKDLSDEARKKLSLYLMAAAHTQLLTGFALFFLLLPNVNHMKIGIKMLLAIDVAVVATLYRRSMSKEQPAKQLFVMIILVSAVTAALVAFLL